MSDLPNIAIIIPARHASTRLPGKPLVRINGVSMLQRVVHLARYASRDFPRIGICVATENLEIQKHAKAMNVPCILTPPTCASGSDRALAALKQVKEKPDFIINLQGDAPFTEPRAISKMIETFYENREHEVITPVHLLSWTDLDRLREKKKTTPFSGTTATINANGKALWFSKNIIPALRGEKEMRAEGGAYSPVWQHMGLYGFRRDVLERYCLLKPSHYEKLEGLEQLRMIENGISVQTIEVEIPPGRIQSGIDTAEDVARAEAMIEKFGDPIAGQKML